MVDQNRNHVTLRILQQNLNKSLPAQLDFLHSLPQTKANIIILQEPYIDKLDNTRALPGWITVYPSSHAIKPEETRTVTMINKSISSDTWTQVKIDSGNVILLKLITREAYIDLYNTYIDCNHSRTFDIISATTHDRRLSWTNPKPRDIILAGDFNRHHPLWEEDRNHHMFTKHNLDAAQMLINITANHGLAQTLPKNFPTLQSTSSKNWTRPDNVFMTDFL